MALPAVSVVTVTHDGLFFSRLLVEKVRQFIGPRQYEIIVVDRGSHDGTRGWMANQSDVQLLKFSHIWTRGHGHAEAAGRAIKRAKFDRIVLLDSDAHPVSMSWLAESADKLDLCNRLAGAAEVDKHKGNPYGWYIHPHFMTFFRSDFDRLIVLRKMRGEETDTGEMATIRVLEARLGIIKHQIIESKEFSVGIPGLPTVAGGVFHAWYVTRLLHDEPGVARETDGQVTAARYLVPMMKRLREAYHLDY